MDYSDLSFWIFVVCAVAFLAGTAWLIKSYRDAKYAAYFFLREEAALRVKRLMFVLVPLAVIVVFLGLRLFGAEEGGVPISEGTAEATAEVTPTRPAATARATLTAAAATEIPAEAATEAPTSEGTLELTEAPAAEPTEPPTAEITEAAPGETAAPVAPATVLPSATEVSATGEVTPALTAEMAAPLTATSTSTAVPSTTVATVAPAATITGTTTPITATGTVTGTAGPSPTPTTTDTPVFSTVTPNPEARIGPITFSLGVTSDLDPENAGTVFAPTEGHIYAFFEYHNMMDGVAWRHVWFRDSEEIGSEGALWEWGSDGRAYIFFAPVGGYTPGRYRVRIYIGDELKQSGSFVVR